MFAVTWEGSGKAVKAHRRVLCRDGPCFAHVLKPSKWSMATRPGAGKGLPLQGNDVFAVTWEGSSKAEKAHRGVLCPDGPCFAQVLSPSTWMEWGMAIWRHGQALAKASAAGQCVRGDLGRQWQRVWCLVDRAGRGPSRPNPHTCGDPRRRPAWAKARQGSADISFCLWLTCYMVCCGITSKDQEQIINDPFTRYPRYPVPKS